MYQCQRCGLTRASSQEPMGLAMPQCKCAWEFVPPVAPQRTWVGLTNEEFKQIMLNTYNIDLNVSGHSSDDHLLWNAIEAKLKEKNT